MDRAASQQGENRIARLAQLQSAPHQIRIVFGHLEPALVAEEVGGMEQKHMQGMAFDPFPAVEQPA